MRDALIIFISIIAAMAIGGYLFLNGTPSTLAPAPESPVVDDRSESFNVLIQGQDAGSLTRRTNYRIVDDVELVELWRMIYGTSGPALPIIDFTRYEVIGVFDGSHSTGGYGVSVTGILDQDGTRIVRIRREVPGETCIVTQGLTSPFQLVRVEKTNLPITREEETVTNVCP
jgi:hypothetical protein